MSENGWQRWFAWYPIKTESGEMRWLRMVEYRLILCEDDLWHRLDRLWSYRDIPDYTR